VRAIAFARAIPFAGARYSITIPPVTFMA
jgi:hypothetical protein